MKQDMNGNIRFLQEKKTMAKWGVLGIVWLGGRWTYENQKAKVYKRNRVQKNWK